MVRGDPTTIFSVALTRRAVATMALRRRGVIPEPQGPVVDYSLLGGLCDPHVFQ